MLQPVSPNLNNHEAADKVDLQLAGYLPPSAVDVPGRVIMVCYPRVAMSDESRREAIEQQKWIKGHLHVQWRVGEPPLDGPSFDLLPKLDGAYKHSSELPPFARRPRARSTAEMKFAIALEPCPGCGLRDARGLELFGNDDLWTFGGRCPECRTVRTHSFETTGAPYLVNPRAYELGEGPSQIISEETFRAELSRVWPAVVSDPTLRNSDEIEHFHDFRGWCSQCLWAIDNRTAAIE